MPKSIQLKAGQKFNRLTIIKLDRTEKYINPKGLINYIEYYLCKCECGNNIVINKYHIQENRIKSCGCIRNEKFSNIITKHNMANTKLYITYQNMKARCYNKNYTQYKDYGGRGIKVCDVWLHDFKAFHDWSIANGYKEGLSIDRINNDGNYEPNNCRWVITKIQNINKRSNHLITYNGETHCIAEWAEILGIKRETLTNRINTYHWSIEKSFKTPIKYRNVIKNLVEN